MPNPRQGYKRLTTSGVAATGPCLLFGFLLSSNSGNACATISNHGSATLLGAQTTSKMSSLFMSAPGTEFFALSPGVGLASGAHVSMGNADYCTVFLQKTNSRGF